MPISYDDEHMRSILESAGWSTGIEPLSELMVDRGTCSNVRMSKVRDYKDKFILNFLQEEARRQNPGFCLYDEMTQAANIIWLNQKGIWGPAGYSIASKERWAISKYEKRAVLFPESLDQLYVRPAQRRNGLASQMVRGIIQSRGHRPVWVVSPKWETKAILSRLGYEETEERYEVWQMMEGLTKWVRRWDL